MRDVDQQPQPVRGVSIERPFETQHDSLVDLALVEVDRLPVHVEQRRPGRDELTECGEQFEDAARPWLRPPDAGADTVTTPDCGARSRCRPSSGASSVVRVDVVQELAGLLADELDQAGHPQRLPDVMHVDHHYRDADDDQDERGEHGGPGHVAGAVAVGRTSCRATMAKAKVATNRPMALWLGLSRSSRCTIRGENWPIASWTTTIVIVSTRAAMLTIEVAIVVKIVDRRGRPTDEHLRDRLIVES